MDWFYWTIFLLGATIISLYANAWYKRPSSLPSATIISFAHQTLEKASFHLREADSEITQADIIDPYLRKQKNLDWRQRRDVINYILRADWLYQNPEHGSYVHFRMTAAGRRELDTAESIEQAALGDPPNISVDARGAHSVILSQIGNRIIGNSGDIHMTSEYELSARLADALRFDARSAGQSKDGKQAETLAGQIDDAVAKRDPARIDKLIGRTRDLLQAASYAFPLAREVIQLILK